MDRDELRNIVADLPEKLSRSRLEPYRELIVELRRLRRTYREIAQILGEKCQLHVSAAAVHNFVRLHVRRKRNPKKCQPLGSVERSQADLRNRSKTEQPPT